jgi:aryl-alcohol dehydrogenase-like predicted oxidoreductase
MEVFVNAQPSAAAAGTIDIGGDLTVNRLGFGAMRITGSGIWGEPPTRDQAIATLRRVVELGVNFIDTADSYGPEVSETLIAEALHPYPDDLVIATKGGLVRPGPNRWDADGRPEHLREACEGSLRRLKLDQIPLYQLHRPDPKVPLAESLGVIAELKNEGKIRHVGISNVTEEQLHEAQQIVPIVSVQNRYNVTDRQSAPLVDLAEQDDLSCPGPRSSRRKRTSGWPWRPSGSASPSTRSCWPGCWPARRRSCRSPAPDPRPTPRRTSRPRAWS